MTLSQGSRSDQEALVLDVEEDGSLLLQMYVKHTLSKAFLFIIIKFTSN